jgi:hypothetical protein
MDTKTIAEDMAALFKAGKSQEIGHKYWADDVVSIEAGGPEGMDPVAHGRAAVQAKNTWWADNHEVENATADGPFVNGDQIAFRCEMDVKVKASGQVMHMKEICLYALKDGKIAEERFLYGA